MEWKFFLLTINVYGFHNFLNNFPDHHNDRTKLMFARERQHSEINLKLFHW